MKLEDSLFTVTVTEDDYEALKKAISDGSDYSGIIAHIVEMYEEKRELIEG